VNSILMAPVRALYQDYPTDLLAAGIVGNTHPVG
jgi:hypothetical protein